MRKIAVAFVLLTTIGILSVLMVKAYKVSEKQSKKNVEANNSNLKKIPLFEFATLDGKTFSKYDLDEGKSTIIVLFDPDCELCEKSGAIFEKFQKFHANSNVLFVSSSPTLKIKEYQKKHLLDQVNNIKFLQCQVDEFFRLFNKIGTPTYFIYNVDGKLIKVIDDDIPIKILLRYFKASQVDEKV